MHLLEAASILESFGMHGPLPANAGTLCTYLGLPVPTEPSFELMIALHTALAERIRDELRATYTLGELDRGGLELRSRVPPQLGVLGLHGAGDKGRNYAAVFFEQASALPLHVVCPSLGFADDDTVITDALARLKGLPTFVIGLSAGGIAAWRLRERLAADVVGIVAVGAAPWRHPGVLCKPHMLFVHGTEDRHFRVDDIERFVWGRSSQPMGLYVAPGFGHSFPYRLLARYVTPWMNARLSAGPFPCC